VVGVDVVAEDGFGLELVVYLLELHIQFAFICLFDNCVWYEDFQNILPVN
jgi:hypothetical protein